MTNPEEYDHKAFLKGVGEKMEFINCFKDNIVGIICMQNEFSLDAARKANLLKEGK